MKAPQYTEEFGQFWQQYPRKTGKGAAWASWQKVAPPLAGIVQALAWQRVSRDWLKDAGAFVPMPATYLNQRRWEDSPPTRNAPRAPQDDAVARSDAYLARMAAPPPMSREQLAEVRSTVRELADGKGMQP